MKKRILTLALALILLISAVTVPVSAASKSDVYNYLKSVAMEGEHDEEDGYYFDGFCMSQDAGMYFAVFYWENSKNIELSIYCGDFEVTMVLPKAMNVPYDAYVVDYNTEGKGTVKVNASYNGTAFNSFKSFSGDASNKAQMLEWMNQFLPIIIELTRAVINYNGYTLKDMGLTSYNKCDYIHVFDNGRITQQPTCSDQGIKIYTCRVCGATRTEYIAPTGEHTWDKGKILTEPTCTTEGVKRFTCTVCKTATKDEMVPALGHAWSFDHMLSSGEGHDDSALYVCNRCGTTKTGRRCAGEVFTDMPAEGNWAHDPIDWAYFNGITSGKTASTFNPRDAVTRAEAMFFLWKAMGSQEPSSDVNPFTDVKESNYFYKAVLWAVEKGITSGATATTFAPKQKCTRAQTMMFIWAAKGKPEPSSTENPFTDVPADKYYLKAVLWAVEKGIASGVGTNKFGPNQTCNRAQIVTFLYKLQET